MPAWALARADCALFHGGATLNECVRTETPMIIYPNALMDAATERVEFHGVGEVGTMREPASSIGVITRVISDREVEDRLQAIAAQNSKV